MRIKLVCECGADFYAKTDKADEATVQAVVTWIRMHSLHGISLVEDRNRKFRDNKVNIDSDVLKKDG